jgi:alkylation response protein AidB-like acyl-CoA dehydrogenase
VLINHPLLLGPPMPQTVVLTAIAAEVPAFAAHRTWGDLNDAYPREEIVRLVQIKALRFPLLRSQGGFGVGTEPSGVAEAFWILRLLGRANLSVARLYEGHINAIKLVLAYGSDAAVSKMVDDVTSGHLFAIWNSEQKDGVILDANNGIFTVKGCKTFVSGVGHIDRAVATGRLPDHSNVMFICALDPLQQPHSRTAWSPTGMKSSATGKIDLTGITVSPEDLIGSAGDYYAEPDFSAGAWRALAVQLGGMESLCFALGDDLVQMGRTALPAQRSRLADVVIACENARLWSWRAACLAEERVAPTDQIIAYVNLARAAVSRAADEVMIAVRRGIGARALIAGHPAEQMLRDLAFYLCQPAPDHVHDEAAGFLLDAHAFAMAHQANDDL